MTRALTDARSDRPTGPLAAAPPHRATTAREALIAEAIGDVGHLLDRIDPLLLAMQGARKDLADAKSELDGRLYEFKVQVDVFTERASVWFTLSFTMVLNGTLPRWFKRFSRMRSKTTMVSWTENPITTKSATTKLLSIWTFWKWPRMASSPAGMETSWEAMRKALDSASAAFKK